jgi:hypothetical protein
VKPCFAHDEIFLKNLPNNGASVSRAVKRNQPCCIKIVKWFYSTLVAKSFVELAYRVLAASVKAPEQIGGCAPVIELTLRDPASREAQP